MARSLKPAFLALLISPVTSLAAPNLEGRKVLTQTPTCSLVSNPSTSPAYNVADWCSCENSGAFPTTSPPGIASPSGNQLCKYTTWLFPSQAITPTPVTCNLASATSGFTIPHSWCDCNAGTGTATYSTIFGSTAPTGVNGACSFVQEDLPVETISPSAATCVAETAYPPYTYGSQVLGGQFYNHLIWCACGDNSIYPAKPNPNGNNLFNPSAPNSIYCTETTQPSSTITLAPIPSTSCLPQNVGGGTTVCDCSEVNNYSSWVIQYPSISNSDCIYTAVPTATYTPPA